jgi:hypothetical protein
MPAVRSTGIETGVDKFKRLTDAQKIAIIGKKRFELYNSGLELDDFVSEKKTEFGKVPFIVPLDQLPDPKNKKQPAPIKKTKKAPEPKPISKTQPKTAAEAARSLKALGRQYDKQIKAAKDVEAKVLLKYKQAWNDLSITSSEYRQQISAELDQARAKLSALETDQRSKALEMVKVGNPTNVKAKFASKSMTADDRARINKVLAEFNSLVSDRYLKDETFSYHLIRGNRAYYGLKKDVHISRKESETTIIHETAHGLEHINTDVLDSAVSFWNHRTKGEKLETLKKLTGINYRSSEKGKRDKFFNAYDGKEPYRANNKIYATEIIARGIEYYWSDPVKMAVEQPEYFDFMYRVLRGEKWQPKSK